MDMREHLQRRLDNLKGLTAPGVIQQGVGNDNEEDDPLENALTQQWKTEAQLIERVLAEDTTPPETLERWRERTESFQENYPDRDGWTDAQGNEWRVDLVLDAIDNVLGHIDNWSTEVDIEGE